MPTIIVKPTFGLGNRILAIASAMRLAKAHGYDFRIDWQPEPECINGFTDLFSNTEFLLEDRDRLRDCLTIDLSGAGRNVVDSSLLDGKKDLYIKSHSIALESKDRISSNNSLFGNQLFYQDLALEAGDCISNLSISDQVAETVADFEGVDFSKTIGLHIRHAVGTFDPKAYFSDISPERWRRLALELLDRYPEATILLCSNLEDDYEFFEKTVGKRILFQKKTHIDRNAPEAQIQALGDMLLLSRSRLIVRHFFSTFAYIPAIWRRRPQLVVRGNHENGAIYPVLCDVMDIGRPVFLLRHRPQDVQTAIGGSLKAAPEAAPPHGTGHVLSAFQTASGLMERREFDQAEAIFRLILNAQPEHDPTLHAMGLLAHSRNCPEEAVRFLSEAVWLKPDSWVYQGNLGVVLKALGRVDEAQTAYEAALQRNPRSAACHFNLANLLQNGGKISDALQHYEQAVAIDPGYAAARQEISKLNGLH